MSQISKPFTASSPVPPQIATQYDADTGMAIPVANVLEILGVGGISTSGSGNTITIDGSGISPSLTITGDTGGAISPVADNWNLVGAVSLAGTAPLSVVGTLGTLTIKTQYAQSIAASNASKVGMCAFDSSDFAVDANGFVTMVSSGSVQGIIGTANQVLANGTSGSIQTGNVTLTTPQDIATTSDVTFNTVSGAAGSSGAPTYTFTGATDTGMFRNNNDVILSGGGYATISAGFNVLISGGVTTISQGVVFGAITTQDADFTTLYSQHLILVDVTTNSAAITVQLVTSPINGQVYTFKDSTGAAATYNITISGTDSGETIDGQNTYVINSNYGAVTLIYNSAEWSVI